MLIEGVGHPAVETVSCPSLSAIAILNAWGRRLSLSSNVSRTVRRLNEARKLSGVSMSRSLVARLVSSSTASMPLMERESWLASTAAMLPDSAIAARIASDRSSQIVQPTALAETPSRTKAAHHSCRSGMDSRAARATSAEAGATRPGAEGGTFSDIRRLLAVTAQVSGRRPNFGLRSWVNRLLTKCRQLPHEDQFARRSAKGARNEESKIASAFGLALKL